MRFIFKTLGLVFVVAALLVASILGWGHIGIRRVQPPLPTLEEVLDADPTASLPVRLSYVNTASQRMPRSGVLDPKLDPEPHLDYVMSHTSFVLEWQDGRIFLIDTGMDAEGAIRFGGPLEQVAGADPIEPHKSTSDVLDRARSRVAGIGFTHLHADHTGGLQRLCRDLRADPERLASDRIPVYQTRYQLGALNHTTRTAKSQVREAQCTNVEPLLTQPLIPVPGFPGLSVIPAGGHTPCSQFFVAHVRSMPGMSEGKYSDIETWIFTGDIVNHVAGVEKNISKPPAYSWLVVPEDTGHLEVLRRYLKQLSDQKGVRLLVSHDRKQIEASGISTF
jgi:glyoxylase-like metal-dependent hydrolase (beta-lactamase superfamily II)